MTSEPSLRVPRPHPPEAVIRDTGDADIPAIQTIYTHAVLHGLATFEEVSPSVEEMTLRLAGIRKLNLPFLSAEQDGVVVGYSYARPYRPRAAYRHTVEDSVYVAEDMQGRGIGRLLLTALIERCEENDCRQMIAVIGDINNAGSIALHRRLGFRDAGTLEAVGYKLGQWVDTVQMQRTLGSGSTRPPS